jgi:hypothetical protein
MPRSSHSAVLSRPEDVFKPMLDGEDPRADDRCDRHSRKLQDRHRLAGRRGDARGREKDEDEIGFLRHFRGPTRSSPQAIASVSQADRSFLPPDLHRVDVISIVF